MFRLLVLMSVLGLGCGDAEQAAENSAQSRQQVPYGALGSKDEELQKCYQHVSYSQCDEAVQKVESEQANQSRLCKDTHVAANLACLTYATKTKGPLEKCLGYHRAKSREVCNAETRAASNPDGGSNKFRKAGSLEVEREQCLRVFNEEDCGGILIAAKNSAKEVVKFVGRNPSRCEEFYIVPSFSCILQTREVFSMLFYACLDFHQLEFESEFENACGK